MAEAGCGLSGILAAMIFRFKEGESVRLKEGRPALGLKAGDMGRVWALYALDTPAYEVTFRNHDGSSFDVTMTEEELLAAAHSPAMVQERRDQERWDHEENAKF